MLGSSILLSVSHAWPLSSYRGIPHPARSVHPYSSMFHRPSFMMGTTSGQPPMPWLMNAICALGAPLSRDPTFRPSDPQGAGENLPIWQYGSRFAEVAIYQLTGQTGPSGVVDLRKFPGQELEVAQTLCCLSFRNAYLRPPGSPPSTFLRQALAIVMPLGASQWGMDVDLPRRMPRSRSASPSEAEKDRWVRRECHRRTLWVVYWATMICSAISLTPKRLNDMNINMPLPVDDGIFEYSITEPLEPGKIVILCSSPLIAKDSRYTHRVPHHSRLSSATLAYFRFCSSNTINRYL